MRFRSPRTRILVAASLAASLFVARPALAAWNSGGEIIPVPGCNTSVAACPDASRGLYTFWSASDGSGRVLRAHRRHADGSVAAPWPANGAVAGALEIPFGAALTAVADGDGGAYVAAGSLYLSQPARIQLWRISDTGGRAAGWPDSGLFVATAAHPKDAFLVSDGAGGVFVGWVELLDWFFAGALYSRNAVRMVRVLANGSVAPGWSTSGNSVFEPVANGHYAQRYSRTRCVADGAGGAWVAHADSSDGLLDGRLFRMTSTGSLAPGFAAEGVRVGSTGAEQAIAGFAPDGAGGVFTYGQSGQYPTQQVRLGRFAPNGLPAAGWTADGLDPLPAAPGIRFPGELVSDEAGGVVLADGAYVDGWSFRLLRVGANGSPSAGWPALGVAIPDTLVGGYGTGTLAPDGTGGAFLVGSKSASAPWPAPQRQRFVAARVAGNGTIPAGWPTGTLAITDSNVTVPPLVVANGLGSAYVLAQITPQPPDYAPCQALAFRIGPDGTSTSSIEAATGPRAGLFASPNPSRRSVGLTLTLPEASQASVDVIDVNGRRIRTLDRGMLLAGPHRYVWDGRDDDGRLAPPGLYMVRAQGPSQPITTKVVRVL